MGFASEIFLTKKNVTKDEWEEFIQLISKYNGNFKNWQLYIKFIKNEIHYYVKSECLLPSSINNLASFILKKSDFKGYKKRFSYPYVSNVDSNVVDIKNYFSLSKKSKVCYIKINFKKIFNKIFSNIEMVTSKNKIIKSYNLLFSIPAVLLSVNFLSNYNLVYKSAPKYLDISKGLHLLKTDRSNSIFKVDAFPYLQGEYYLEQKDISFFKHSLIFGSSGCGKSKFISLLIDNIRKTDLFKTKYKVVVIDPHAALEKDIGGIGRVIDFKNSFDSINLFCNSNEDTIVSSSLLLDLFKGLLGTNYNSKLERVLRHSLYLLLSLEKFNFKTLRKLLLEIDFRSMLIKEANDKIPISIIEFFLTEFNEIKTKSYTEAISPIIAFIDEMEMFPIFNEDNFKSNLKNEIDNNFLTIFSLDRTKLGDQVTKMISGLVMQQMFTLIQNYTFDSHIIFIIDEVSVVENAILNRFLAEARKYNLSLILAGQYFNGTSNSLQKAIFANVINYYIFRLSTFDANTIVDNLNIKIPLNDTREQKVKLITDLQDRECLIRVNSCGNLLPVIKCSTLDFKSYPRIKKKNLEKDNCLKNNFTKSCKFNINSNLKLNELMKKNSTGRGDFNE